MASAFKYDRLFLSFICIHSRFEILTAFFPFYACTRLVLIGTLGPDLVFLISCIPNRCYAYALKSKKIAAQVADAAEEACTQGEWKINHSFIVMCVPCFA